MTQVWLGVVIAAAAGAVGLVLRRLLSDANRGGSIDVGPISQSWLSEQRAGKRDDRFSH
jgi:hypothetical protein